MKEKVKEYAPRFKQSLKEMAELGETKNNIIKVESKEHLPIHLHAISKNGDYNVRISIADGSIISYKFKRREMRTSELREVQEWLNDQSDLPGLTNSQDAERFFKKLNPDLFQFKTPKKDTKKKV